jgi:putative transposase
MVVSYSQKGQQKKLLRSLKNEAYNILRKAIPNAFSSLDRELRTWAEAG